MEFVSWKDRKLMEPALKAIVLATDAEAGRVALDDFEAGPVGHTLSGHCPKLVQQLAPRRALCLPDKFTSD